LTKRRTRFILQSSSKIEHKECRVKRVFVFVFLLGLLCYAGSDHLIKRANQNLKIRNPRYFVMLDRNNPPFSPRELNRANQQAANFRQKRVCFPGQIDDLLVADLNKDGFSDLAILDFSSKKILTWMGDNTLQFAKRYERKFADMKPLFAGAADYTEDKKLDLAIDNSSDTKHFSIFPGDGTGKLKNSKTIVSDESSTSDFNYATTLDFNGDGKPDLLGLKNDGTLIACRNLGKAKFKVTKIEDNRYNSGIAAGDFDGDKNDDFFVAEPYAGYIEFFRSNGDGTFTPKRSISVEKWVEDLYAADITGDKKLDLIGAGGYGGHPWTMNGQGNGNMLKKKTLPGNSTLKYGACVADINGDKKLDIVSAEQSGLYYYPAKNKGVYEKYYVLGQSLNFGRNGEDLSSASNIGVGNFNGDKKPDIVGAQYFGSSSSPSTNLVFFINGEQPANLQISNLKIESCSFDGKYIYVKGSVDYSGSGIDFHFDASGKTPYDSAFMKIQFYLYIDYFSNYYITAWATGDFMHKPGTNSGTIDFDLTLPSPVVITGTYTSTTTVKYVYLTDYNLVTSNQIIP
jgi:hypothetical protein